jgi:hypothetical protein
MSGRTPIEVGARYNGGIRVDQGGSYIMLDRDEALELAADIPMAETTRSDYRR